MMADRDSRIDCQVVLGESALIQHMLLVLEVQIRRGLKKIKYKLAPKLKWWQLKKEVRSLCRFGGTKANGRPKMIST